MFKPVDTLDTMDKRDANNGAYYVAANFESQLPSPTKSKSSDENTERGNWSNKMDFVLSCLSYAVGLGNVWRFPYLCYRNGGGAFLIPFIVMLFITGIPLVFLELSFGQYASEGVVSIWKVSPIFQGVGWAMFIVSVLIAMYYNMIIAWTLYYLFASFAAELPWSYCGDWSSPLCFESRSMITNCTTQNGTWYNSTCYTVQGVGQQMYNNIINITNHTKLLDNKSPSDEYFHNEVLDISGGVYEMGKVRWQLALCLLLAWVLVCICLAKGIKTSGKAVYFTAFFPYVVLLILLIRGVTLEGSADGILYYITPKWELLKSAKVWGDAAVQIFFSLSPCWGGLITLASYNKFNNNCLLDAILVSVLDCLTSVFAGLVIFSIIGYMAHELQQPIDKVAQDGAGLAFVVYPEVVTKLPISQLWAVLFFAMLVTLGLGTQIATVTTVHTTLKDQFPHLFRSARTSVYLLFGIAFLCFIIGLAFCTQGGMYVLQLFDNYAATYSLLCIGFVECIALAWVYGADRFLGDIESMLGRRPPNIWSYSWKFIAPIALLVILVFTWVDFKRTKYSDEVFPVWADVVGWLITLSSVLAIPTVAIYKVIQHQRHNDSSIIQSIRALAKPTPEWGPALKEHRAQRETVPGSLPETYESQVPLTLGSKKNGLANVNGQVDSSRC
ncbi:sodium- and chloride-dependent glycine transporter 1-like isoform X1 [Haliotis rufescens]|uniref:sodium- and chloride-dependent glycine transporter 1-like isoform X1 n=2 Tax=Haliotis rufescens TaxID=6454 RepID=UPI00201F6847|nr:sodium- and chloride-dependent glycine transporter 1-like isoform X1 [Haliotis rufescens]